jgi:hypothetical protein
LKVKNHTIFLGILLVLLFIFFFPIITGSKFFWEDVLYEWYPSLSYLAYSLRAGRIPFWTPYVFAGMPFLGDPQAQVFYPINWILPLFVHGTRIPYLTVELQIIFHLLLAGFFMYLLCGEFGFSFYSRTIAAITFVFSGFFICNTIHLPQMNVYTWFPLIFLFFYRALKHEKLYYGVLAGIVFAIASLAGHPQFAFYMGITFILFFVYYLFHVRKNLQYSKLLRYLFILSIFFMITFGTIAIQYIFSLNYAGYTPRFILDFTTATDGSLQPIQLVTLFIPKFFGSIAGDMTGVPFWLGNAQYHYWETCIYLGIVPLLFILAGIFLAKDRKRFFFVGLAALSLLLCLGKYTPLYRVLFYYIPGFNKFRIPGRFSATFTFSSAILVAYGVDFFYTKWHKADTQKFRRYWRGILIFAIVSVVFWFIFIVGGFSGIEALQVREIYTHAVNQFHLYMLFLALGILVMYVKTKKKLPDRVILLLFVGLIFSDLYVFGHQFNARSVSPDKYFYFPKHYLQQLKEEREREFFRINARAGSYMLLRRNQGNLDHVELIEGYEPLRLERFEYFNIPNERKLSLLNVKYKITIKNNRAGLDVHPTYLPRAKMYYNFYVVDEKEEVLNILSRDTFDYQNILLLEEEPPIVLNGEDSAHVVRIVKHQPEEISIEVKTEKPGLLFLSEMFYPEWNVYVNGEEKKMYCADYALRAVPVGAGEHRVVFKFDRTIFMKGLFITIATLLLAIVIIYFKI